MNKSDFGSSKLGGKNYDRFEHEMSWFSLVQKIVAQRLAEKVSLLKRPRILEIGCGTGATTEEILRLIPRCELMAIDSSDEMLCQAKERVKARNVKWLQGDSIQLLGARTQKWSGRFDAIVSALTIHNLPSESRLDLLQEMACCLAKNAWIINADLYACDNESQHTRDFAEHILGLDAFIDDPEYRLKWLTHYLEDERIKFTQKEQLEYVDTDSFENTSFTPITRMVSLFMTQFCPKN